VARIKLIWQSKLVLLVVLPAVGANLVLETHWWAVNSASLAIWTIGLCALLGLVAWKLHSATAGGAFAGAVITASMMYSTAVVPYAPWRTAIAPVLAVLVLTSAATRLGRASKERLGLAEKRHGRSASQVAANLGFASLISCEVAQSWLIDSGWFAPHGIAPIPIFAPMLAALAEAAADTVSSEIGQVFGGRPFMLTTLRRVDPGSNGAISLTGTLAGMVAAGVVAALGGFALFPGNRSEMISETAIAWAGGVFGLFFDSLLGATIEQRGWLSNDLVNFLSTASSAAFALGVMAVLPRSGIG
jgi:uncharacterized protein (TIGR00297 family)